MIINDRFTEFPEINIIDDENKYKYYPEGNWYGQKINLPIQVIIEVDYYDIHKINVSFYPPTEEWKTRSEQDAISIENEIYEVANKMIGCVMISKPRFSLYDNIGHSKDIMIFKAKINQILLRKINEGALWL